MTIGLKPGELKMDLLRSYRRAVRSQNIFLNFAGRSFVQFFDEGHTVRRLKVREVRPRKLAKLALICARALQQQRRAALSRKDQRKGCAPIPRFP